MAVLSMQEVSLYIIIGILAAIVYSLRTLFAMERKIITMESNIQSMLKSKKRKK